jgi:hypothetical protein
LRLRHHSQVVFHGEDLFQTYTKYALAVGDQNADFPSGGALASHGQEAGLSGQPGPQSFAPVDRGRLKKLRSFGRFAGVYVGAGSTGAMSGIFW